MALQGSVSTNKYNGDGFSMGMKCTWSATQSVSENKSVITWTLASEGGAGYSAYTGNVKLDINGVRVLTIDSRFTMEGGGKWSRTGTLEIPHNADGTKSFTINITAGIWNYASSNCTGTGTFTLDQIARASSATVPNFTIGTQGTISISRASSNFTHVLSVKLGGSTYELATNVGDTCRWTPSAEKWGPRIPNSTSAKCTMIVDTYNGSTKIGTNSYAFTLYVPANIVPTISSLSVSIVNDNTTVNSWGIAVKGYTKLQWSATASGASGSSIESWAFTAGGLTGSADSGTTGIIQMAGSITPSIKVTDSRDRTATKTASAITVHDYAAPNVTNASAYRCDADGNADESGTNVRITLTAHISSVNGKNSSTLQYRYKQAGGSFNGWTAFTSGAILSGFDAAKSYEFELRTVDALGNAKSTTITVPTESVWLNGKAGGKGAAFGKYAEEDDLFDVAWRSRFRGAVTFDTLPAQVAPSGYGLGGDGRWVTDLNTATENGWYCWTDDTANAPFGWGSLLVVRRSTRRTQIAFDPYMAGHGGIVVRHYTGSEWTPWEWFNPPMNFGVEYRTTKRFANNQIYTQALSLGGVSAGGSKTVEHGIANIDYAVTVTLFDGTGTINDIATKARFTTTEISVTLASGVGGKTVYAIFEYTKL